MQEEKMNFINYTPMTHYIGLYDHLLQKHDRFYKYNVEHYALYENIILLYLNTLQQLYYLRLVEFPFLEPKWSYFPIFVNGQLLRP